MEWCVDTVVTKGEVVGFSFFVDEGLRFGCGAGCLCVCCPSLDEELEFGVVDPFRRHAAAIPESQLTLPPTSARNREKRGTH